MMNPEIKAEWIAALRSGEFEQGRGKLAYDGRHCCLGVLCELAVKAGITTKESDPFVSGLRIFDGNPSTLPPNVMTWAGLFVANPDVLALGGRRRLSHLNDSYRFTFAEIADAIESSDI